MLVRLRLDRWAAGCGYDLRRHVYERRMANAWISGLCADQALFALLNAVSSSGTQCIVPWGFCPKPGANATSGSAAIVSSPSPSLVTSPSPAPTCVPANSSIGSGAGGSANLRSVSPVNGACPLGFDWDPFGVLCNSCPAGFSGSGCATCNSDAACKVCVCGGGRGM